MISSIPRTHQTKFHNKLARYFYALLLGGLVNAPLLAQELTSDQLGIHKVGGWRAVSNNQLIIEDHQHSQYLATFKSPCKGLKDTKSIAFANHSSHTINKSSTVILGNGNRCAFKEFTRQLNTAAQ